jgi:hypothetical protein
LVRGYANGASSNHAANGVTIGSGDSNSLALDQIILGAGRAAPSTYSAHFDGKTAFLGIIAGDVSAHAQWPAFKQWVAQHYGITIA